MFTKTIYAILTLCLTFTPYLWASSIVVIQGSHTSFGRRYFAGFSSLVRESIVAYQYQEKNEAALIEKMKKLRPDLIMTIGDIPLHRFVAQLPTTPFIIGDYQASDLSKQSNVVFMENSEPIEIALEQALSILGPQKRIGTIYDPKYSSNAFERLEKSAQARKMKIVTAKVDKSRDIPSLIPAFAGKMDLFIYIRDVTTSAEEASSAIFSFCSSKKIPVVSLDPGHSNMGALMTVSVDPIKLGEQAWNVSQTILIKKKIPEMSTQLFRSELTLNLSLKEAFSTGLSDRNVLMFLQEAAKQDFDIRVSK